MGTRRAPPCTPGISSVADRNSIWPLRLIRDADFATMNRPEGWAREIDFSDTPIGSFAETILRRFKGTSHLYWQACHAQRLAWQRLSPKQRRKRCAAMNVVRAKAKPKPKLKIV